MHLSSKSHLRVGLKAVQSRIRVCRGGRAAAAGLLCWFACPALGAYAQELSGPEALVGLDEWVANEYAKVRRFYSRLKIPERTAIEFFDGIHEINAKGTFEFLDRHLKNIPGAATQPPGAPLGRPN